MSWTSKRAVTVVAVVLLVASLGVVWQIADVRAEQAASAKADDLVNQQVPTRQAPADYDGDGVNDSSDACPTRAETTNGFQDGDGCPDVVATTGAS